MKLKFIAIMLFAFVYSLTGVQAQQGNKKGQIGDRIQAQMVAYLTSELSLTPQEAEKFWPVYNDYTNRKNKLDEESKTIMKYITRNSDNLSDKEINESMEKFLQLQEQIHKLFLDYHQQYLQILPPKKVMKIYITENQFKAVLLNQIRENRQPVRAPVR